MLHQRKLQLVFVLHHRLHSCLRVQHWKLHKGHVGGIHSQKLGCDLDGVHNDIRVRRPYSRIETAKDIPAS